MGNLLRNIEKSSFLIWVVGLMSIAIAILIMFQYRWVQGVLEVNNDKFQRDVREALHVVSYKIERKEISNLASNNFDLLQKNFFSQSRMSNMKGNFNQGISVDQDTLDTIMNQFNVQIQSDFSKGSGTSVQINLGGNTVAGSQVQKTMRDQFQQFMRKSRMIDEVFESMWSPQREITDRIQKRDLDSLLKSEFKERGINLNYNYGVFNPKKNHFVMKTGNVSGLQDKKNDFQAALFPNDVLGTSHFLKVDFPNKTGFLLRKIWMTLASSALLVFVIIFCFAYAVYTILQQKKLSEMKTDFINNMTHEFKTPIATISLACEALNDGDIAAIPEMNNQYIGIIQQENKRLGSQVEKVLQIAMVEKDKLKLSISNVSINDVVNNALGNVRLQIENREGVINFEDATDRPVVVEGDEVHLTNMINNLLDNSNKYSPNKPEISIALHNDHEGVYVSISDKGCGMTPEQQSKVFEKFYRVSTGDVHDVKGFGLGLSYVKYVVDAHHGNIKLNSSLGYGSTFEVFLPYNYE